MKINFRPMESKDIPGIFRIDQQCFEHNWTLESYECEVENIMANYNIAELNGEIIGFGGFWAVVNVAQITNIGVLEKHRRCGIGQSLLNEMMKLALNKDCVAMTLEVRADNPGAIALYEKNGFEKAGVRGKYYDNKIDGIIMWRYGLG